MRIGSYPQFNAHELPGLREAARPPAASPGTAATKGHSFNSLLENAVSEVDSKMQAADVEKGKLLTGETTNVHQAVIAMQEASVAFSLMVEVRNKMVESYQELMRMQV